MTVAPAANAGAPEMVLGKSSLPELKVTAHAPVALLLVTASE